MGMTKEGRIKKAERRPGGVGVAEGMLVAEELDVQEACTHLRPFGREECNDALEVRFREARDQGFQSEQDLPGLFWILGVCAPIAEAADVIGVFGDLGDAQEEREVIVFRQPTDVLHHAGDVAQVTGELRDGHEEVQGILAPKLQLVRLEIALKQILIARHPRLGCEREVQVPDQLGHLRVEVLDRIVTEQGPCQGELLALEQPVHREPEQPFAVLEPFDVHAAGDEPFGNVLELLCVDLVQDPVLEERNGFVSILHRDGDNGPVFHGYRTLRISVVDGMERAIGGKPRG